MTVCFPSWNIRSDSRAQVRFLPWDRLGCICHAFWKVAPQNGGFTIVSADPWADTDPDNPLAHFPQYAEYAAKYPDRKILLSIGGWAACGFFSEMARTPAGRSSFIRAACKLRYAGGAFAGAGCFI